MPIEHRQWESSKKGHETYFVVDSLDPSEQISHLLPLFVLQLLILDTTDESIDF